MDCLLFITKFSYTLTGTEYHNSTRSFYREMKNNNVFSFNVYKKEKKVLFQYLIKILF